MSAAGQGFVYKPKYRDRQGNEKQTRTWWIGYSIGGKKHRESSRSRLKKDAVRLLNQRLSERGQGTSMRDLEKVIFEDLVELIRSDYRKNRRRSADRLENSLKHLSGHFGNWRVVDIHEGAIDTYAADRMDGGAAAATVNREMSALRRMFRLGQRARITGAVPFFDMLEEKNVRKGFFEPYDFSIVVAGLPDYLKALAEIAYITGWRRGELLSRRWRHVDFEDGWLRLDPGETKNDEGRIFPLIPKLRQVLEGQHARKLRVEEATGRPVSALFFHNDGRPIKDFRYAWEKACVAAGLWEWQTDEDGRPLLDARGNHKRKATRLFHDLRRTAARNLVRAGIPAIQAKQFTGHQTMSVFTRYCIQDEVTMREAGEKYATHLGAAEPTREEGPDRETVKVRSK